jgi:hypothetical protein
MPSFNAGNAAFTPPITNDNWTLDAQSTTGVFARVTQVSWGGSGTSSIGYRTRWTRPSTDGSSTFTAITFAGNNPNYVTPALQFGTFATAPTVVADPGTNLFSMDWNVQGGGGILILPLAQPWWLLGGGTSNKQQLSCRNTKGGDASLSSYSVTWEED